MIIDESIKSKVLDVIDTNAINMNIADMLMAVFSYTDLINPDEIKQYIKEGLSEKEAILEVLYDFYRLEHNDENDDVMGRYIANNLKKLEEKEYLDNPYVQNIKANAKLGKYQLRNIEYEPYQLFAYDDIYLDGYKEYSRIGYFTSKFPYLALTEGNNVWMSLNPNEIETMKPYIKKGKGNVLVLGLGMGYVPYMMSLKDEVKSITIIEKDKEIIELFKKALLPQFINKSKIKIIEDDAISYLNKNNKYDYIFADLWHNPEDGLSLFVQLKRISKNIDCWLEMSLYQMLRRCMITLLEEQLEGMGEDAYKHARTYTDKVINRFYQKTKNLRLDNEDDLHKLLSDESLINLAI